VRPDRVGFEYFFFVCTVTTTTDRSPVQVFSGFAFFWFFSLYKLMHQVGRRLSVTALEMFSTPLRWSRQFSGSFRTMDTFSGYGNLPRVRTPVPSHPIPKNDQINCTNNGARMAIQMWGRKQLQKPPQTFRSNFKILSLGYFVR
jgi:hypothetical protein